MRKKTRRSHANMNKVSRKSNPLEESEAFRKGLAARNEVSETNNGQPPEGVTHQIVGHDSNGLPIVRRLRFSLHD